MEHVPDPNREPEGESGTGLEAPPLTPAGPDVPLAPPPLPTRRIVRPAAPAGVPLQSDISTSVGIGEEAPAGASPGIIVRPAPVPSPEITASVASQPDLESAAPLKGVFSGISRNVFVLGVVSFFTDVASQMIVPVRILFLVTVLQTPLALAGLIEGVAASAAGLVSIVSGRLADRPGRRKPLMLFGYGLSSLVKPLLAFVASWQGALGLILLERAGNGVRSGPRNALLADSTPAHIRGKAFGFHRGLDTLGAIVGPLLAFLVLLLTYDDVRAVLLWTAVPGGIAVLVLLLFVRERRTGHVEAPAATELPLQVEKAASPPLGKRFWMFTATSVVFAFGNSSDAFIFLRTADLGDSLLLVPLVYFGFNVVYALFAGPLGKLTGRFGRLPVLLSGYTVFALVYLGWAVAVEGWNAWALFLVYGIYAAATEGIGKAFVADMVPPEARATAFAWFGGLVGLAAIPANLIAGWLWSTIGPSATFTFGAWSAAVAIALTLAWMPWLRSKTAPETLFTAPQEASI